MWAGIALIAIGVLALLGIRFFPIKKNWAWVSAVVGLLIITGWGASLLSGAQGLAISEPQTNTAPDTSAYSYSVLATPNLATEILDAQNHIINDPLNITTAQITTLDANFTIAIKDSYADMRGVPVSCNTNTFYQQNTSVSDSTQYLIVQKDTAGKPLIKIIQDTASTYVARDRTFLLGGQSTLGQSVNVRVLATLDATALSKVNAYNSIPVTCSIAGEQWTINVQRTLP